MLIQELKQELLDRKTRNLYVFTGDELALQDVYIKKIAEVSGLNVVRIEYLKDVFSRLSTRSLIKTKPLIYVIRNDEDYLKKEASWKTVLGANIKKSIIILLYSGIDKNTSFIKTHEDVLTRFDFIDSKLLSNRLRAVTNMPKQYCDELVRLCGNNYGKIQHELYKLQMLSKINGYNINTAFLQAVKNEDIHENVGDIIFNFTNAITSRNIKNAYALYPKILQTEDGNAIKLLSVLYNSFRQLLMVQSTPPEMRTEDVLGLSKGQIYVASKNNSYNIYEIVNIVKTIRYLEKGIKTGTIDEEYAMEYLMGTIW